MKKALFIALVVIVVVTGLPVLMGMGGMSGCTDCGPGLPGTAACLPAMMAAGVFLLALMMGSRVRAGGRSLPYWLLSRRFERPPQLV